MYNTAKAIIYYGFYAPEGDLESKIEDLFKPSIKDSELKELVDLITNINKNKKVPLLLRRLFTTEEKKKINKDLVSYYRSNKDMFSPQMTRMISKKTYRRHANMAEDLNNSKYKSSAFEVSKFTKKAYMDTFNNLKKIPCINAGESAPEAIARFSYLLITGKLCNRVNLPWLINPKRPNAKTKLEIDIYDGDEDIYWEINGMTHYDPDKNRNPDGNTQIYKDSVKHFLCKSRGITLIDLPYCISHSNIIIFMHREISKIRPKTILKVTSNSGRNIRSIRNMNLGNRIKRSPTSISIDNSSMHKQILSDTRKNKN